MTDVAAAVARVRAERDAASPGPWKSYHTTPGGGGSGWAFLRDESGEVLLIDGFYQAADSDLAARAPDYAMGYANMAEALEPFAVLPAGDPRQAAVTEALAEFVRVVGGAK